MEIFYQVGMLVLIGLILFLMLRKNPDHVASQILIQRLDTLTRDLTINLQDVRKEVQQSLLSSNRSLNERLDNAARLVAGVENKLGKLEESNKRIFEVGKDIASLQEILRAPKLRGNIGELFLGDLLTQMLPKDRYSLQYAFKTGEKVDAAIFLHDDKIVPVDAKFPLENFRRMVESASEDDRKAAKKEFSRDLKKHVDAIAAKYIVPDEGTFPFALMYIPAENVYYEVIIKDTDTIELAAYCMEKRVIPVSPNNFYIYLQTILMGLKGMQVEKNVRQVLSSIAQLQTDFGLFREEFLTLGKHLGNARNKFDDAEKRLNGLENKLTRALAIEQDDKLLDNNQKQASQ